MHEIKIFIAESNLLIRNGLKFIYENLPNIEVVAEASSSGELISQIVSASPNIVVIDYLSPVFRLEDIETLKSIDPKIHVVAITETAEPKKIRKALEYGVSGHVLKDCSREEIVDVIYQTNKGERFFCGKVLEALDEDAEGGASCEPVSLSNREIEIIRCIAEGKTNKQIAEELFLSTHTVMTHRKNIMNKLGINNTAGIVIYAVKENLISPNKFLFND